jgi:ribosomal protein S18 acetylase RimI-like enzyme
VEGSATVVAGRGQKEDSVALEWIEPASPEGWGEARRLIEEYVSSLGVDLSFQEFDREIANLSHEYGPPDGAFLLVAEEGRAVGCVGLRRLPGGEGEIKRLYVVPACRGRGIARALAERILECAQERGYTRLLLDTLPSMQAAQSLYRSLGFKPTSPYRFNPVEGTVFMELELSRRE